MLQERVDLALLEETLLPGAKILNAGLADRKCILFPMVLACKIVTDVLSLHRYTNYQSTLGLSTSRHPLDELFLRLLTANCIATGLTIHPSGVTADKMLRPPRLRRSATLAGTLTTREYQQAGHL
jgi:hypothetical protein